MLPHHQRCLLQQHSRDILILMRCKVLSSECLVSSSARFVASENILANTSCEPSRCREVIRSLTPLIAWTRSSPTVCNTLVSGSIRAHTSSRITMDTMKSDWQMEFCRVVADVLASVDCHVVLRIVKASSMKRKRLLMHTMAVCHSNAICYCQSRS